MPIVRLVVILVGVIAAAGVTVALAGLMEAPSPVRLAAIPAALVASTVVGLIARRRGAQKDRP